MSIFGGPSEPVLHIGATVHYVMRAEDYGPGATRTGYQHRPAIVLDVPPKDPGPWPVGLVVLLAGAEDGLPAPPNPEHPWPVLCAVWKPGIVYSAEHTPGTWHWPEAA